MEGLFYFRDEKGFTFLFFDKNGYVFSLGKSTKYMMPGTFGNCSHDGGEIIAWGRYFKRLDGIKARLRFKVDNRPVIITYEGKICHTDLIEVSCTIPVFGYRKSETYQRYSAKYHLISINFPQLILN